MAAADCYGGGGGEIPLGFLASLFLMRYLVHMRYLWFCSNIVQFREHV